MYFFETLNILFSPHYNIMNMPFFPYLMTSYSVIIPENSILWVINTVTTFKRSLSGQIRGMTILVREFFKAEYL